MARAGSAASSTEAYGKCGDPSQVLISKLARAAWYLQDSRRQIMVSCDEGDMTPLSAGLQCSFPNYLARAKPACCDISRLA